MKNTKFLTLILEISFCYCYIQMCSSPLLGLNVGGFGDAQCFLGIYIQSVTLLQANCLCLFHGMLSILLDILNLGDLCILWSNGVKSDVIIHRIEESSIAIDECFTRPSSRLQDSIYIAKMQRLRFSFTKHIKKNDIFVQLKSYDISRSIFAKLQSQMPLHS